MSARAILGRSTLGVSLGAVALAVVAVCLLWTSAAGAYFSTSGAGTGRATTGTLSAPTGVSATSTAGTGKVTVSWTASSGTPAPTGYYVTRTDPTNGTVSACGTSATAPISATSCTDTLVPVGKYTYNVVAVYRSWTATSTPSAAVSVAKADQTITFTPDLPTAAVVGTPYNYSVTGGASGNAVVVSTSSSPAGVCSGGGSSGSGSINFLAAGQCTITATQPGNTYYNDGNRTVVVTVSAPAAPTAFSVSAPSSVTAGTQFAVTIRAQNNGVTVTSYTGTHAVVLTSNSGSSPNGTAPTLPASAAFTNGVATVNVTLTRADTGRTITATEGNVTGTSGQITVSAGAASRLAWSGVSPAQGTVGSPCLFTCTVTNVGRNNTVSVQVGVTDIYGNVVSDLGSGHSVALTSDGNSTVTPATGAAVPATGPATTAAFTVRTSNGNSWTSSVVTAASTGYTSASITLNK
jgi:hypothetical protein